MSEQQQTPRSKGYHYQLSRRPRSSQTFRSSLFDKALVGHAFHGLLPSHDGSEVSDASPTWRSSIFCREKESATERQAATPVLSAQRRSIATGLSIPDDDIRNGSVKTGKKMYSSTMTLQDTDGSSTSRNAERTSRIAAEEGRRKKYFEEKQRSSNQIDTLLRSQFDLSAFPATQHSEFRVSRKHVAAPAIRRECTSFSGKKITCQPASTLGSDNFLSALSCGSVDTFDARNTRKRRSELSGRMNSSVFLSTE